MTRTADEHYAAALAAGNLGRVAAARRSLAAAARLATDPELAARIAGTTAYLDAETGDPVAALARARRAAATRGLSRETRAVLVGQVGLIEMRRGDARAALRHLGRAIRDLEGDPPVLGRLALNRGDVHLQTGDLARAAGDFRTARRAFAAAGLPVDEAKALHNEGYTALLAGDLLRALDAMGEARPALAAASPVLEAVCDLDRAEALLAAGMPDEAARLLAGVIRAPGARGLVRQRAEAELALARTLAYSDPRHAETVARSAARRFRRQGNEAWALRGDAVAALAAVSGGHPAASAELSALADRLAGTGARSEARRLRIAAARNEPTAGSRIGPFPADPVPVRLAALEARAAIAVRRGRPRDALRLAAAGLDDLTRAQAAFGSIELQTSLVLHARPLLVTGTTVAAARGEPETLYAWSEHARAVVSRLPPLSPPPDPAVATAVSEVRRIRALGGDRRREAELLRGLQDLAWRQRGGREAPVAPLEVVQQRLARRGAIGVAITWTGERVDAVVVDRERVRMRSLGRCGPVASLLAGLPADLDAAAARLPAGLAATVRLSLQRRLSQLAARLVAPLALADGVPLVLSIPGTLTGVPWSLLPGLEHRPLTVAPSLTRWAAAEPRPARTAGFAAGPGVDRGEEEVRGAAGHWPGAPVLVGPDAACGAVAEIAAEVDVLHCSGHGRHAPEHPLLSAVELADGPWFGYDVQRLPRVPALVVLSACEVGRVAVRWGQETTGLARAWLAAGADSVIASASAVADDTACETLAALHAFLAAGRRPAAALALAGAPTSFVCFGAG